ncbi:MAG TPA: zinc ribbon domain-containing protein [Candidatus Thermoplasmatota archaeon]|nr:zinc ribbon domain-containing protein [Candidatus Thermoplasmatota archaeon]
MGKKGRKTVEAEHGDASPVDEALPETQELPHDRFPPIWRNIRWGQVVFGGLAVWLGLAIRSRVRDGTLGTLPGGLTVLGAVFLVLAFAVYLHNMYRHGLVPDYSLKCRHCNGPVNRYSEFCEHCGGDLITEEKLIGCPRCGTEVYEGTRHCPECGAAIGKGGNKPKKPPPEEPTQEGWSSPLGVGEPKPWEK